MGKDFCLFVSLAFPWFGLLCHISPLKVSSWHPTPVLTLRTDHIACTSASSLHLLPVGRHECVSRFSACNCHLVQILSWFFFFFFWIMLPSEVQKFPIDLPVRGFPIVWKHLLLHDSLPWMDLCPEILCLPFHLYLLFYLILKRLVCLSRYLGVLCWCSEAVL